GVEYEVVESSKRDPARRGAPTISAMLAHMLTAGDEDVFVLLNADVAVLPGGELSATLSAEVAGALVMSQRVDVTDPAPHRGSRYAFGYDFFAFGRELPPKLPTTDFVLGEPWWDYWLPIAAALAGGGLKRVDHALTTHLVHETAYGDERWVAVGRRL